jgi:hypothetical protein
MKIKLHHFGSRIDEKKPFKVQLDQGGIVTGLSDENYWYRFTAPVFVKKGDSFSAAKGKGLIVNGKLVPRKFHPRRKTPVKIGWAAKKVRIAVFPSERSKKDNIWLAVDVTSYNVSQGHGPLNALRSLIFQLQAERQMELEEEKKGKKVIRWHVERKPGVRKELTEMEKYAMKTGIVLEGIDWEKSIIPEHKWWKEK